MAEIRILDKHTAELIAAGEVVERPASVAKELLENAIDAGATQITLSILSGGIRQLQIADNGTGIEAEYIDKAFIRHATSKIATEADLNHIHTLGFRGEALASIASVARVEVLTRTEADEYACLYRIEGGEPLGMEPGARPVGATITVNDLFYNTPARMKFLKKDVSEGGFVADAVIHAALSHPEISFRFVREGKQQFVTPGDGKLLSAAYAVVGREFARDLLPVQGETGLYKVEGLVTPPRACRASRGAQYFYVNGRYVKNRTMMAAMENAYKGTLMQGKFPGGILMLTMPSELVDVNVHPAKTEIRFSREADVFDAVYHAVRFALTAPGSGECRFEMGHKAPEEVAVSKMGAETSPAQTEQTVPPKPSALPLKPGAGRGMSQSGQRFTTLSAAEYRAVNSLTEPVAARPLPTGKPGIQTGVTLSFRQEREPLPDEKQPKQSTFLHASEQEQGLDLLPEENELGRVSNAAEKTPTAESGSGLESAEPNKSSGNPADVPEQPSSLSALPRPVQKEMQAEQISMTPADEIVPLRFVGEVFKTYIITERGNELCLIDKHAAHERILFERLAKDYGNVPAQMLLVPVQVTLSAEEKQAVLQNLELLQDAGVETEDYGGNTVIVRAVPADVRVDDVEDMLVELAARLAAGGRSALREKTEWVLHSIACRAAIKAGDKNDSHQLLALAQQILDGTVPPFCPHGRPCVLKLTRKELEKQFGRLV